MNGYRLSNSEAFLLNWLGREDVSQMGECQGIDLDRLVSLGLAEVVPSQAGKQRGIEYNLVRLTEDGRAVLETSE